jgi:hypothetical protein
MVMTHYMELLSMNQPWNLILFMVIPVGMAELLVATEFFTLYWGEGKNKNWRAWNRYVGMCLGIYFLGVVVYLASSVVPSIAWRGWIDQISVYAYLLGVIPLFSITLLEWRVLGRTMGDRQRVKTHAILLIAFLVVSHIAMIFGMADPQLGGWQPTTTGASVMDHSQMDHSQMRQDGAASQPMDHSQMKH